MKNLDDHSMDDVELNDDSLAEDTQSASGLRIWVFVGIVLVVIFGVLFGVMDHAIKKPTSPQALVAAAFNQQTFMAKEWKPGQGPQPLIYHPAGFQTPGKNWTPMYLCPTHGATGTPTFDGKGIPHCSICNQLMVTNK